MANSPKLLGPISRARTTWVSAFSPRPASRPAIDTPAPTPKRRTSSGSAPGTGPSTSSARTVWGSGLSTAAPGCAHQLRASIPAAPDDRTAPCDNPAGAPGMIGSCISGLTEGHGPVAAPSPLRRSLALPGRSPGRRQRGAGRTAGEGTGRKASAPGPAPNLLGRVRSHGIGYLSARIPQPCFACPPDGAGGVRRASLPRRRPLGSCGRAAPGCAVLRKRCFAEHVPPRRVLESSAGRAPDAPAESRRRSHRAQRPLATPLSPSAARPAPGSPTPLPPRGR